MGLDTTHNCWHGSYGTFNRFREWLFRNIGLDSEDFIGYGDNGTKHLEDIGHPIAPLLNHSDCSGTLNTQEQESIILGGNQILTNLLEKNEDHESYLKDFIKGCEKALKRKETVGFH